MSTDMNFEEACRLHGIEPGAPGPITEPGDLRTLLDIVVILLCTESPGEPAAVYTADEIIAGVRELLDPGQTVAEADIRALLPGDSFVEVEGGYRWK